MRKIIFSHRRAVGDQLMLTAGIRDFKHLFPDIEIAVNGNFKELYDNNPYVNQDILKDKNAEKYVVGYPTIQNSNSGYIHFTYSFLLDMIAQTGTYKELPVSLPEFCCALSGGRVGDKGDIDKEPWKSYRDKYRHITSEAFKQRADIHLSEHERSEESNLIKNVYGEEKYWIVAPGGKSDCFCKIWDWRRFQYVIDHFYEKGITFVQIGKSDHVIEKLRNTIDLTDKTSIRQLIPLTYHAEGVVSGVSFLMHLAAAVPPKYDNGRKPCVAIYGGREPVSFTGYTNHQILHANGTLDCCDSGGCWKSDIIANGRRTCDNPIESNGRYIQKCMDNITANDVIRAISKYYEGKYKYGKRRKTMNEIKEINVVGSLRGKGGGEQSLYTLIRLLKENNTKVRYIPIGKIHENYDIKENKFKENIPTLLYGNDDVNWFLEQDMIDRSSKCVIAVNYTTGNLKNYDSKKITGIIFQNEEKMEEFRRQSFGFESTPMYSLYGVADLSPYYDIPIKERQKDEPIVVLKHGTPDYRKYTTKESIGKGEKKHVFQKHIIFETDIKFYERLAKDNPLAEFRFMEAHKEVAEHFKDNERFTFYKFDEIPVKEFLQQGHVWLDRCSRLWRANYPRTLAEAMASGLPALGEPRDGYRDRIRHGDTGFFCCDYDAFNQSLKLLTRKDRLRREMGKQSRIYAKENLYIGKWITTLNELLKEA